MQSIINLVQILEVDIMNKTIALFWVIRERHQLLFNIQWSGYILYHVHLKNN